MDENERLIQEVLNHWKIKNPKIVERFHSDSERLIYRIASDEGEIVLKGIPDSKQEEVIRGNVAAHEYLGNQKQIAPKIIALPDGETYIKQGGYWFYLMESIDGRKLSETIEDEYAIGKLARKLHSYSDYQNHSSLNENPKRFYQWFQNRDFKKEFDAILDSIPDFSQYDTCFIHTDIGPHNTMTRKNGETILIDLDDAGIGSRFLDLGWPFIMQFVDLNHSTGEMNYRFDLAEAFVKGYYGEEPITQEEYDMLWQGAVYMHISYMKTYGPDAVNALWKMLKFGMDQKQQLWKNIKTWRIRR